MIRLTCFLLCAALAANAAPAATPDIVDKINEMKTTWTAKRYPAIKNKMRLGVLDGESPIKLAVRKHELNCEIPDEFEVANKWPQCKNVIGNIRNQADCGSCWAVAAAGVFSDRQCIASNGQSQTSFSAEDILSCCTLGGSEGCGGGWPDSAWQWLTDVGVVTGGNFTNRQGCRPYMFCPPNGAWGCATPQCRDTCDPIGTLPRTDYAADKHKALAAFVLEKEDVQSMQLELMANGSLEVSFTVYSDFYNYEGGIYQKTPGARVDGGHAVRLVGWGVENGTPYWRIANSWGFDWGEAGYFRIVRGVNECGIEDDATGGDLPASV